MRRSRASRWYGRRKHARNHSPDLHIVSPERKGLHDNHEPDSSVILTVMLSVSATVGGLTEKSMEGINTRPTFPFHRDKNRQSRQTSTQHRHRNFHPEITKSTQSPQRPIPHLPPGLMMKIAVTTSHHTAMFRGLCSTHAMKSR